ncbi:MAG: cyanophycin synthetase, partial [Steroidobacteraceae bacterium]
RALSHEAILGDYIESVDELAATFDGVGGDSWSLLAEAPPGHVALQTLVLHALWDGWVHERDIALPLGLTSGEEVDEVTACLLYAAILGPTISAAAAAAAGASLDDIASGLADIRAVPGRLQLKAGARDSWIIDDSYNANPSSVRAGLEVMRSLPGATWLVLGDMAELGEFAEDSHAHMGAYARDCGIKRLFALGTQSSRAVETFGSGGEWFADAESLTRRLQAELAPGVTVLIKGSRINRLERVVQALTGGAN